MSLTQALAQLACFATKIQRTGLISYCMKIQNTVNFARELPLRMPVAQETKRVKEMDVQSQIEREKKKQRLNGYFF